MATSARARARVANSHRSSAIRRSSAHLSSPVTPAAGFSGGVETAADSAGPGVDGVSPWAAGRESISATAVDAPTAAGAGWVAASGGRAVTGAVAPVVDAALGLVIRPAAMAFMTGSSPLEIGMPTSPPDVPADGASGGAVRGRAGSMIRPGTGAPLSRAIGIAPGIAAVAPPPAPAVAPAVAKRTVVRRSVPLAAVATR